MDPYLERHWPDVHGKLVINSAAALNRLLPPDLVARSEERLEIGTDEGEAPNRYVPDIAVFEPGIAQDAGGGVMLEAPYKLVAVIEGDIERFLKILEPETERVITVIEFLSPSNKIGKGLEQYLGKRNELIGSGVHVVEVDLVRQGTWKAVLRPHACPNKAITDYRAVVRLGGQPQEVYYYPISIRRSLPAIPIPLRAGDPHIALELQLLIDQAYVDGRYGKTLHYDRPCDPPLDPENEQWFHQLPREK
jgi:hypothetical protein